MVRLVRCEAHRLPHSPAMAQAGSSAPLRITINAVFLVAYLGCHRPAETKQYRHEVAGQGRR